MGRSTSLASNMHPPAPRRGSVSVTRPIWQSGTHEESSPSEPGHRSRLPRAMFGDRSFFGFLYCRPRIGEIALVQQINAVGLQRTSLETKDPALQLVERSV